MTADGVGRGPAAGFHGTGGGGAAAAAAGVGDSRSSVFWLPC